jgi:hypothetical protein
MPKLVIYLLQLQRVGPLLLPTFERGPGTSFWGFFAFRHLVIGAFCNLERSGFAIFTNLASCRFAIFAKTGKPGFLKNARAVK